MAKILNPGRQTRGMGWVGASALAAALSLAGCDSAKDRAQPAPEEAMAGTEETVLTSGRRQTLAAFRGKARILTLFFSHCQSTCPMVLGTLKGLAEALPKGWEARATTVPWTRRRCPGNLWPRRAALRLRAPYS